MARYLQTWTCNACGHVALNTVSFTKGREPRTPYTEIAKRARCSKCGVRGQCTITERKAGERPPKGNADH